jgi:hypothetical protein
MVDRLSKTQRLHVVFNELDDKPPAKSALAALGLVVETLNSVEDRLSGVPREPIPPLGADTGRMYPPQPDQIRTSEDGTIHAFSRRHVIVCAPDGSISVSLRRGPMVYFKEGLRS